MTASKIKINFGTETEGIFICSSVAASSTPPVVESTESTKPTGNSGGYQPTPTKPTEPTKPQKEIASIQIYEDCDGSGHGVKVITYTDGTQEEVPF